MFYICACAVWATEEFILELSYKLLNVECRDEKKKKKIKNFSKLPGLSKDKKEKDKEPVECLS